MKRASPTFVEMVRRSAGCAIGLLIITLSKFIHGNSFTAINGTGERISHAVGTAFQACLAKKQEMEKAWFHIENPRFLFSNEYIYLNQTRPI